MNRPLHLNRTISILFSLLTLIIVSPMALASGTPDETQTQLSDVLLVSPDQIDGNSIEFSGCGGQYPPAVNAAFEEELVYLINQERTARGFPPYKHVEELDASARYHAYDLGQDDYFAHETKDRVNGELQTVCSAWDRIIPYYSLTGWQWLGETIAGGQPTPQDVLSALMNSEPHRAILLSSDMWEVGVGYYRTADGRSYWVQDYGKRSGAYPLVINDDAPKTLDEHVSLYLYGTWQEVRLRNDDGTWSEWMPFSSQLPWILTGTPGEHTVWAELRSGTESVVTSDSINMAVTIPLTEVLFLPLTLR